MAAERRHLRSGDGPDAAVAVQVGDLVFVGGAIDAGGGTVDAADDVRAQATAALERIGSVLEQAGGSLDDLVDVVSLHSDARGIGQTYEAARDLLGPDYPAWTPAAAVALPVGGRRVTMSAIARLGDEPKQCIVPDTIVWWRELPASAGCRKGDLLFVAGQYGSDADGNVNTPGDHAGQARNALNRIKEICELAGGELDDVIDLTSFHQDPRWIGAVVELYEDEFFDAAVGPAFPSWTTVGTPGLLRHGMLGEYRAIADLSPGRRLGSTPSELGWRGRHVSGAARRDGGRLVGVTGIVASDRHGEVTDRGDPEAQARGAFEAMGTTLAGLDASLADVVQVTSYHLDTRSLEAARRVARDYFKAEAGPAWTSAAMTGFWREGQLHCIQALAVV